MCVCLVYNSTGADDVSRASAKSELVSLCGRPHMSASIQGYQCMRLRLQMPAQRNSLGKCSTVRLEEKRRSIRCMEPVYICVHARFCAGAWLLHRRLRYLHSSVFEAFYAFKRRRGEVAALVPSFSSCQRFFPRCFLLFSFCPPSRSVRCTGSRV